MTNPLQGWKGIIIGSEMTVKNPNSNIDRSTVKLARQAVLNLSSTIKRFENVTAGTIVFFYTHNF